MLRPNSTLAALNLLDELDGRKVAVLGDMLELGHTNARATKWLACGPLEVVDELVTVGERGRLIAAGGPFGWPALRRDYRVTE